MFISVDTLDVPLFNRLMSIFAPGISVVLLLLSVMAEPITCPQL